MTRITNSIPEEKKKQIKSKVNDMFTDEMIQRWAQSIHKYSSR